MGQKWPFFALPNMWTISNLIDWVLIQSIKFYSSRLNLKFIRVEFHLCWQLWMKTNFLKLPTSPNHPAYTSWAWKNIRRCWMKEIISWHCRATVVNFNISWNVWQHNILSTYNIQIWQVCNYSTLCSHKHIKINTPRIVRESNKEAYIKIHCKWKTKSHSKPLTFCISSHIE